jgi:tetratricopeptide (TPR) repeat protein
MLKARKKITHKEIKQDKLVTAYFSTKEWVNKAENKKRLYSSIGIIVVIIVLIFFYVNNRKAKNEEAEVKLSAVISLYDQNKYQEAINGDPASNIMGIKDIVDRYGSTESGETAKLYLGNCYFNLNDFDNALKQFEDYSGKNDIVKASCFSGIGAVYEAKGDMKKAGEYFEKAAKVNKDVVINPENLYYAVRSYSQAGDKESARRVFDYLKDNYPKSKYISDSRRFEPEFKN